MIIKEILPKIANAFQKTGHYLHRTAPCSQAFGLFDEKNLVGVVLFGTPSSSPLRRGICGPEEQLKVIELTRLYLLDSAPHNSESFLIAGGLRGVRNKDIVVSFADTAQNHLGIVYQSTNWLYTGLSAKRTNWSFPGATKHSQTIADKYTSAELREKYGEDFKLVPRSRKHRYVFFLGSHKRRKELRAKLRYPVLSYPTLAGEVSRCDTVIPMTRVGAIPTPRSISRKE